VTFGAMSEIKDDNFGIDITGNSAGSIAFQGDSPSDFALATGGDNALFINANTGGTYTFNNFTIDTVNGDGVDLNSPAGSTAVYNFNTLDVESTGSGRAFSAIGDGTLAATGTNRLQSNTDVALEIQDMTISNNGVQFQSINVTNSTTNGIFLEDLTGGAIILGSPAGAANSGGMVTSADEAIIIRNVANIDVNNIRIVDAGGNALLIEHEADATHTMDVTIDGLNLDSTFGTGVRVNAQNDDHAFDLRLLDGDLENNVHADVTGAADFGLLVDSTEINTTTASDIAFAITFSGGPGGSGDITFRNENVFEADDQSALRIDLSGDDSKTVRLLVEDSTFSNSNDMFATSDILVSGNSLLQATIQGNEFDNDDNTGSDFDMSATGTNQARIELNLGGDSSEDFNEAAGAGEFNLFEVPTADFRVFDAEDTFDGERNTGTVVPNPTEADFMNLDTAPPLPTVP
jgi:hypothetical protein